uniref:LIM zinc-binding domain-containing protein n=1 Tax=Ditylenchus dipsaci TaxID=166011 RepID=A0A915CYT8_9BILA
MESGFRIRIIIFNQLLYFERETIHNQCFKCGFCDAGLKQGSCAMTRSPYGLHWYCSGPGTKQCSLKNTAEKEAKLKEKGAKQPAKK